MVRRAIRLLGLAAPLAAAYALLGAAAAAAGPIGLVCTNGPEFDLVATSGSIETPDGNSILMWSYANSGTGGGFQLPGPVLCVNQGDTVTVNLHNELAENVSVSFPGQQGVSAAGAPGLFTAEAPPGSDATYTFVASQPGTYLYESGTDPSKQVEMGLYGALVVRPAGHPDWAYASSSTRFDPKREYILVLHEIDPALHHAVETGGVYDFNALHFRYFSVNGREFPDTVQDNGVSWLPKQPYGALVRVQPYDASANALPALVRIANAGLYNHPFHPHGFHLRVIAQDGRQFLTPSGGDASTEHFGDVVAAGSTQDTLFTFVDKDHFSPQNPLPVAIPSYRNLMFKDNVTWFGGSPYPGYKGTLPNVVTSFNVCGELYFPWHSHALNEFTNFDEGFGGMATLLRVDPLGGCFSAPASTKILAGSLKAGTYAKLAADDAATYDVKSTTVAPFRTDWYAGFTGLPAGLLSLKVTYKGRNSLTCNQTVYIWKWATSQWVQLWPTPPVPSQPVGSPDVLLSDLVPPGSASDYVGSGAYKGQLRVRVFCQGASAFFASGNLMKIVYDAP